MKSRKEIDEFNRFSNETILEIIVTVFVTMIVGFLFIKILFM